MSGTTTPPGFYPDGHGDERWWDGTAWTERIRTPQAAGGEPVVDRRSQKEAERAQKEAQRAAERQRASAARAAAEFARTPVGQARAAFARGDGFFQLELEVSKLTGGSSAFGSSENTIRNGGRPDLLGQIEDEGFVLEHVGYIFIETGATSTNRMLGTGQGTVTRGVVQGIYLFRRAR